MGYSRAVYPVLCEFYSFMEFIYVFVYKIRFYWGSKGYFRVCGITGSRYLVFSDEHILELQEAYCGGVSTVFYEIMKKLFMMRLSYLLRLSLKC